MAPDRRSDEDLVRESLRGDAEAFGVLVDRHQGRVYGLMMRATRRPELAEELAQDAFLRAWKGLPGFDSGARFAPWLYRIAMNVARSWWVESRREGAQDGATAPEDLPDATPGPSERLALRQAVEIVRSGLDRLSRDQREAVVLRHWMGLSYGEVALVTGQPLGTVKTNLFRARASLKEIFDEGMKR